MISTRHIAPRETNTSTERPYRPLLVIRPQDLPDRRLSQETSLSLTAQDAPIGLAAQDTSISLALRLSTQDAPIGLALRLGTQDAAAGLAAQDAPACREALRQLITGDNPFLLLPDTPDDSLDDTLDRAPDTLFEIIALCMFSRQYIRIEGMPVLPWQAAPSPGLIRRLQAQGWPEIRQWDLRHAHWLTGQHQVAGLADTILGATDQPCIFIEGHDLRQTIALEEALHRHCTALLQDNPPLQALLTEKNQLQKKLDTLKSKHRVLQERMHNAETTIGIIRSKYKDDYDTLFSWYQQEYEALPLWYKRFGQLIKVLTGKRTAKSLVLAIRRRLHRHTAPRSSNSHLKKDRT